MKKVDFNEIFNAESKQSHWEITNHDIDFDFLEENIMTASKTITLHYVPEDDYSEKDIKITMPHDHFIELVKFMKTFK